MDYLDTVIERVAGEDSDNDLAAVIAYVHREYNGSDITARVDRYASQIKFFLEAYVALGFAAGTSRSDILSQI